MANMLIVVFKIVNGLNSDFSLKQFNRLESVSKLKLFDGAAFITKSETLPQPQLA
jgi:hypothetical protein